MTDTVHCDVESRSQVNLKTCGAFRYWQDPGTELLCMAWAINKEPVELWIPGQPAPKRFNEAIRDGARFVAHNRQFEALAFKYCGTPRHGFAEPTLAQSDCTAARAAAMGLPRDLHGVGKALGLKVQKDDEGHRIMMQLCKPRAVQKAGASSIYWEPEDAPEKFKKLYDYCMRDVDVERLVDDVVPALPERERQLWMLDQIINERGVPVDIRAVQDAIWVVHHQHERLNDELARITGGYVRTGGQIAKITEWLAAAGVDVEKLDSKTVTKALESVPEGPARRVLEIRQELAKSSIKKLPRFHDQTSQDCRARGNLMFCGASTGRWSGRGIQLQNLPRPSINPKTYKPTFGKDDIDYGFSLLPQRDPVAFENLIGPPTMVLADMMRGFMRAPRGKKFIKGDFSNIEGRKLAWLAGEEKKLDLFRAADAKTGPDIYLATAAGIFNVPVSKLNKESPERQVGKVAELACGFQGGVGAVKQFAKLYDVHVTDSDAEMIRDGWRASHPNIVAYWARLEKAVLHVVRTGQPARVGKVSFSYSRRVLWCHLPVGRRIAYVDPIIKDVETPWGDVKEAVTAMSVCTDMKKVKKYLQDEDSFPKWQRVGLYGGFIAENVTQASARDCMVDAMFAIEAAGYPIILTVHDELISEVDVEFSNAKEYEHIMQKACADAAWQAGLPVRVEADECIRYRK